MALTSKIKRIQAQRFDSNTNRVQVRRKNRAIKNLALAINREERDGVGEVPISAVEAIQETLQQMPLPASQEDVSHVSNKVSKQFNDLASQNNQMAEVLEQVAKQQAAMANAMRELPRQRDRQAINKWERLGYIFGRDPSRGLRVMTGQFASAQRKERTQLRRTTQSDQPEKERTAPQKTGTNQQIVLSGNVELIVKSGNVKVSGSSVGSKFGSKVERTGPKTIAESIRLRDEQRREEQKSVRTTSREPRQALNKWERMGYIFGRDPSRGLRVMTGQHKRAQRESQQQQLAAMQMGTTGANVPPHLQRQAEVQQQQNEEDQKQPGLAQDLAQSAVAGASAIYGKKVFNVAKRFAKAAWGAGKVAAKFAARMPVKHPALMLGAAVVGLGVYAYQQSKIGSSTPDTVEPPKNDGDAPTPKDATVKGALYTASREFKIPESELYAVAFRESSFDPNAKNPRSGAVGLFQFLQKTWNSLIKKYPDFAKKYSINMSTGGMDDRTDPFKSAAMYSLLRMDNMGILQKQGATTGNQVLDAYLAHFLGVSTAKAVILAYSEKPDALISQYVSQTVVSQNPEEFYKDIKTKSLKTVKQFVDGVAAKVNTGKFAKADEGYKEGMVPAQTPVEQPTGKGSPDAPNYAEGKITDAPSAPKVEGSAENLDAVIKKESPRVNTDGLQPQFKDKLTNAIGEYVDETGKKPVMTSAFRSSEDQARLHAQNPSKAAPPGRSKHEIGMAADINSADLNAMDRMGLLAKNGLVRPVRGEAWHVEDSTARGPSGKESGKVVANAGATPIEAKSGRNINLAKDNTKSQAMIDQSKDAAKAFKAASNQQQVVALQPIIQQAANGQQTVLTEKPMETVPSAARNPNSLLREMQFREVMYTL